MDVTGLIPYFILCAIVSLIATLALLCIYSGIFRRVTVESGPPPLKGALIAYRYSTGPYKNSGYYFTEITSIAPRNKSLGIYYDNPEEVADAKDLRWVVASVLAEGDVEPDADVVKALEDKGYKQFRLPDVSNAVKTVFPHRTILSVFFGIYKVYPEISHFMQENRLCAHPAIEIYNGDWIEYMMPLAKQDQFYVPESQLAKEEDDEGMSSDAASNSDIADESISVSHSETSVSPELEPTGLRRRTAPVAEKEDENNMTNYNLKEASVVITRLPNQPDLDEKIDGQEVELDKAIATVGMIDSTELESSVEKIIADKPDLFSNPVTKEAGASGDLISREPESAAAATSSAKSDAAQSQIVPGDYNSDSSTSSFEKVQHEDIKE